MLHARIALLYFQRVIVKSDVDSTNLVKRASSHFLLTSRVISVIFSGSGNANSSFPKLQQHASSEEKAHCEC